MDIFSYESIISLIRNNLGLLFTTTVILLLYKYYTSTHDHFKKLGIPYMEPVFLFGNIFPRVFLRLSFHDFNLRLYHHFRGHPFGGFFEGRKPVLIIRDPDQIKNIMIKDFEHFTDRNVLQTNAAPYIQKMMLNLKGTEWKNIRSSLTPAFSSGKLRSMEHLLQECGMQMKEFLQNKKDEDMEIEMKKFMERYTLEVIGSCAFGLDCASLKDSNAEFVKVAARFGDNPILKRTFLFFSLLLWPKLLKYIPISFFNGKVLQELCDVVTETKTAREKYADKRRNDFIQLMVDVAQKEIKEKSKEILMSDDIIKAQSILFLIAGFETTSTLISFCCSALCEHSELQDKLRKEILQASLQNTEDKSMYDLLNEIPLLEKILLETLRMYPPVSRVDRVCTKPYKLEGTNIKINVGDTIAIPIAGILHDPDYYPDPQKFDPERFSSEEKMKRAPHLYLPFGAGPRNCIGLRFALMSAKFGIFHLIKNFQLSPCSRTEMPLTIDKKNFLLKAEKGHWMKVEPYE